MYCACAVRIWVQYDFGGFRIRVDHSRMSNFADSVKYVIDEA